MISGDVKLNILVFLFVKSVAWSFSNGLPAEVAHLAPWDDDDWFRRYTTRSWNKYTFSTDLPKFKYRSNGADPLVWILVGGVILASLLILLIKYLCSESEGSEYESSPILHPPPAVIIAPPQRPVPPPQTREQNLGSSNIPLGGGLFDYQATSSAPTVAPSTQRGVDKPPGYSEVVMSNFVGETKFPEVSPLDAPPPKYEEGNLPKY